MPAESGASIGYRSDAVRSVHTLERLKQKLGAALMIEEVGSPEPGGTAFHITMIVDRIRALPSLPSPSKPAIPAGLPVAALAAGAPVTRSASGAGWTAERAWRRGPRPSGLRPCSIASSPFLFRSLARGITGVAGRLLFSHQAGLALFLLGRLASSLFLHRALGCSCRFRSDQSLLGGLGFALQPCRFALDLAFGPRRQDGFALPSVLDFDRIIKNQGLLELFEHAFLGLGCEAQAVLQALIVIAHG